MKFVNGKLLNDSGNLVMDEFGEGGNLPIGSLIGVVRNNDIDANINLNFWKLCTGSGNVSSRNLKIKPNEAGDIITQANPDCNNDHFLMGASTPGSGGNNHRHKHTLNVNSITVGGASAIIGGLGNSSGNTPKTVWLNFSHRHSFAYPASVTNCDAGNGDAGWSSPIHVDASGTTSVTTTISHSHTLIFTNFLGSDNTGAIDGDSLGSNRPQYYKVKYYIRIHSDENQTGGNPGGNQISPTSLKIYNGKLQNKWDDTIIDENGKGILPPIGSIIAVHKNFSVYVDTDFWIECNGNGIQTIDLEYESGSQPGDQTGDPSSVTIILPKINDSRFLMGGDGTNGGTIDDGGNNGGHYHSDFANMVLTTDVNTTLPNHTHTYTKYTDYDNYGEQGADQVILKRGAYSTAADISLYTEHYHTSSDFVNTTNFKIGNFASGFCGDKTNTTANVPQYFSVKYFMRIK